MRNLPWSMLLGFATGCLMSVTLKYLVLPHVNRTWPSLHEDLIGYYGKLTKMENYDFVPGKHLLLNNSTDILGEEWFINRQVKIICFSVGMDISNPEHVVYIITSWARYCDKTYIFVAQRKVFELIRQKNIKPASNIQLLYIDSTNSTFRTAVNTFVKGQEAYSWVVYVPSYVFLIAENLKYFLISCNADPQVTVFIGKPHVARLTGQWSLSDRSPLIISQGALKRITADTKSCQGYRLDGSSCPLLTIDHQMNMIF